MSKNNRILGGYISGIVVAFSQLYLDVQYLPYAIITIGILILCASILGICCINKPKPGSADPSLPESEKKSGATFSIFIGSIFMITMVVFSFYISVLRILLNR